MDIKMTPNEALADFLLKTKKRGTEINYFRALAKGTATDKHGAAIIPSGKRVGKFLEKHAPGRYLHHIDYFTTNGSKV